MQLEPNVALVYLKVSFNPHRTRRPGATPSSSVNWVSVEWFQSSPDPKARCNKIGRSFRSRTSRFQSSPDPKARCNYRLWLSPVSGSEFQSSPDPKARCNLVHSGSHYLLSEFQSSPDPKARCNAAFLVAMQEQQLVSILTGPEGPVQRRFPDFHPHRTLVSILTGPEGPVQRALGCGTARVPTCFNPHRTRRPGATAEPPTPASTRPGFNPHRTRRPGATWPASISTSTESSFNPHRTRRPGATPTYWSKAGSYASEFQSSPDPKARCNVRASA